MLPKRHDTFGQGCKKRRLRLELKKSLCVAVAVSAISCNCNNRIFQLIFPQITGERRIANFTEFDFVQLSRWVWPLP